MYRVTAIHHLFLRPRSLFSRALLVAVFWLTFICPSTWATKQDREKKTSKAEPGIAELVEIKSHFEKIEPFVETAYLTNFRLLKTSLKRAIDLARQKPLIHPDVLYSFRVCVRRYTFSKILLENIYLSAFSVEFTKIDKLYTLFSENMNISTPVFSKNIKSYFEDLVFLISQANSNGLFSKDVIAMKEELRRFSLEADVLGDKFKTFVSGFLLVERFKKELLNKNRTHPNSNEIFALLETYPKFAGIHDVSADDIKQLEQYLLEYGSFDQIMDMNTPNDSQRGGKTIPLLWGQLRTRLDSWSIDRAR